jgi:hypothetical protein
VTEAKEQDATESVAVDRTLLRRVADLAVRVGLPLAVVAVVIAVFLGERMSIDHEVSIMVPDAVEPGARVPVRAFVFEDIESDTGARLGRLPVEVQIIDRRGVIRGRTRLRRSIAGGSEGELELPDDLTGWIGVRAIARAGGEIVATSEASIHARRDPPAIDLIPRGGRTELATFALGPITASGAAPSPFDVRVAGGACVPESRCDLLVHVGDPAASITIAPSAAVTVEGTSAPTSEIARLPVVVRGGEASVELVASRDAQEVARRALRIPIALATPALHIERRVGTSRRPRMRIEVLGARDGIIVDAYRDGRWRHTGTVRPSDREITLPYDLEPGLWRLQVRTDLFSAQRSAVRLVVVHEPGTSSDQAIRELGDAPGGPDDRLAWLSAQTEDTFMPLPEAVSGYAEDIGRLEARQRVLRSAAGGALLLGILIAAILFLRRGVDAAQVAQRVMAATGDPELASSRHRRRTLLSALAIVATVLVAFIGAAAIIAARAHLFE